MFEQTFKNIDNVLWKEAGCTTELDYTEQTSWMLFLKYLDDLERGNGSRRQSWKESPIPFVIERPVSLVEMGSAEEEGWQLRPRQGADRRQPDRIRGPGSSFPLCPGVGDTRRRRGHQSNTRSARFSAKSKTSSAAAISLRDAPGTGSTDCASASQARETRTIASLRSENPEHGQCGAQWRRILHAAPAHSRHGPGDRSKDRRANL